MELGPEHAPVIPGPRLAGHPLPGGTGASQVYLDPAKPCFLCRQQTPMEDQTKIQAANKREMAWGSWIIFLPSQQAKLAEDNGVFALSVNSQSQ